MHSLRLGRSNSLSDNRYISLEEGRTDMFPVHKRSGRCWLPDSNDRVDSPYPVELVILDQVGNNTLRYNFHMVRLIQFDHKTFQQYLKKRYIKVVIILNSRF